MNPVGIMLAVATAMAAPFATAAASGQVLAPADAQDQSPAQAGIGDLLCSSPRPG